MIEYSSLNTIIQTIAVISASIHGIQVRFNHSATMNGKSQRVIFFINHCWSLFDSILSHLAFALHNQKIKSRINIAVIISNHSPLIPKYSRIQAVVSHQKTHTANHSASVILYIKTQIKIKASKLTTSKNLNNAMSNFIILNMNRIQQANISNSFNRIFVILQDKGFWLLQSLCREILLWIDLYVDSIYRNRMNSLAISSVYVQPLGTHANSHLNHINIFLCLFTLEQQQLFFRMLLNNDEVQNHIKAMGIYHKVKWFVSNLACQVSCNLQAVAVIDELQVRLQIIIHSICSQDIVRLSHKSFCKIYQHRLGLEHYFRKAETISSVCLSFRMCFEFSRVLQETNKAVRFHQVIRYGLQLPTDSFNHWRMLGMCKALIQDNRFILSLLEIDFCHLINAHFRCMGFIEIQVVVM